MNLMMKLFKRMKKSRILRRASMMMASDRPTSLPKEVLVGLTKICVSPSVLTIFQNGFFHAVFKHFLHISCAHKTYVVTRNFVVDCLEHEICKKLGRCTVWGHLGYAKFFVQKLKEILQVKFFLFLPYLCQKCAVGTG